MLVKRKESSEFIDRRKFNDSFPDQKHLIRNRASKSVIEERNTKNSQALSVSSIRSSDEINNYPDLQLSKKVISAESIIVDLSKTQYIVWPFQTILLIEFT